MGIAGGHAAKGVDEVQQVHHVHVQVLVDVPDVVRLLQTPAVHQRVRPWPPVL